MKIGHIYIVYIVAKEKQTKGWLRKKKQALIAQNFGKLKELAKSNHPSTSAG